MGNKPRALETPIERTIHMKHSILTLSFRSLLVTGAAALSLTGCLTHNEETSEAGTGQSTPMTSELEQASRTSVGSAAPAALPVLGGMASYNFSSLVAGTTYHFGDIVPTLNATIEVLKFQWIDGTWFAGGEAKVVTSSYANGSAPHELNLNNINVRVIPNIPATSASFKFGWLGGNVNLGVNGILSNVIEPNLWNGIVLGGATVTVTINQVFASGYNGTVTITPLAGNSLERFGTGGQEYFIDDVRHYW
jgi:hypothetical protein